MKVGTLNKANGLFLEFDRWLKDIERKGILQIGNFSGEFFSKFYECGFKNINYVDDKELKKVEDKSKLFQLVRSTISKFNVVFVNSPGNEFEILSSGVPDSIDVVIIRFQGGKDLAAMDRDINTVVKLLDVCEFYEKYTANHTKKRITDLMFLRRK